MATLKRNEPCPCGSGKKYKKCCLKKAEAKPAFDEADQRAFNELLPRIFDYSKQFDEDLTGEYSHFTKLFNGVSEQDGRAFSQLLFHWLIFNRELGFSGETVLERYIYDHDSSYSEKFRELLEDWRTMEPELFSVTHSDGKTVAVKNMLNSRAVTMETTPASAHLQAGDYVIGYLYTTPAGPALGNDAISLPQTMADMLHNSFGKMKSAWDHTRSSFEMESTDDQAYFSRFFYDVLGTLSVFVTREETLAREDELTDARKKVVALLEESIDWEVVPYAGFLHAKNLWIRYALKAEPRIQKPDTFAAALDYWIGKQFVDLAYAPSQKEAAEKYGVSAGTVSAKYKQLI